MRIVLTTVNLGLWRFCWTHFTRSYLTFQSNILSCDPRTLLCALPERCVEVIVRSSPALSIAGELIASLNSFKPPLFSRVQHLASGIMRLDLRLQERSYRRGLIRLGRQQPHGACPVVHLRRPADRSRTSELWMHKRGVLSAW